MCVCVCEAETEGETEAEGWKMAAARRGGACGGRGEAEGRCAQGGCGLRCSLWSLWPLCSLRVEVQRGWRVAAGPAVSPRLGRDGRLLWAGFEFEKRRRKWAATLVRHCACYRQGASVVSGARGGSWSVAVATGPWRAGWSCRGCWDDAACHAPIAIITRAKLLLACDGRPKRIRALVNKCQSSNLDTL